MGQMASVGYRRVGPGTLGPCPVLVETGYFARVSETDVHRMTSPSWCCCILHGPESDDAKDQPVCTMVLLMQG